MASVQINEKDPSNAEMNVAIRGTKSGYSYKFVLKRHHLEATLLPKRENGVRPSKSGKKLKATSVDWNDTLTDAEKTQIFTIILSEYRKRSLGDNGFKGAAIGAVDDKWNDGQTRLFIGTNTTRWASPYFKDCAEQNMVNAATDALNDLNGKKDAQPRAPKFKSIYVLQAKDDCSAPIACPCGKCIDMLDRVMEKKGIVVTVPLPTEAQRKALEATTDAVSINTDAKTLDGVLVQRPKHSEGIVVWQAPIGTLNANRIHKLIGDAATMQHDGFKRIVVEAAKSQKSPKERGEENVTTIFRFLEQSGDKRNPTSLMEFVGNFLASLRHKIRPAISSQLYKMTQLNVLPAEQAVKNILSQRKSVAVLDCAELNGGQTDIVQINQFLVDRITDTLADRMHSGGSLSTLITATQKRQEVIDSIDSIRCVAIQLDDGTFRYAVQVAGENEASMPNAEVAALEQAVESLGHHVVRHVWAMEMNPKDIKDHILRTSPKEGIERLVKRAGPEGIDFHYLPFNAGNIDGARLKPAILHLSTKDIYPSSFKGKHKNSEGQPPSRSEQFSWEEYIQKLKTSPAEAKSAAHI